ncbi:hypothetical protein HMPREF9624_00561 [Oribacterium asaccharolyticum ACB7]|jgi:hypothetical protein|uniref:ATPase n=2 Tax=Bacillota TaxID=1239 RepID=G9WU51_9FIRM|nr:AAA family ATPase [Oribacterium asaccharolyticum]EHL12254.1 hypothetical protein HMPREF9624_00561 [Oribacterium asaccharolyticum ACB7]
MQKLQTVNAETLLYEPLEKPSFVVDSLIPTGLSLFCGSQKIGKSWLMLKLCLCVSQGIPLWDMPTMEGDVLYLCLEDTFCRIQDRLFRLTDEASGRLHFAVASCKLSDGLIVQLEDYLKDYPDSRLIVIDTLQKVRTASKDNAYASDYGDISLIKDFADRHSLAVIVVHHIRKQNDSDVFNKVSGTTGLTGSADATFVLEKEKRASDTAKLYVTGRDTPYQEYTLRFRDCRWELVERKTQEQLAKETIPDVLFRLVDFMRDKEEWIGTATELIPPILQMVDEGKIALTPAVELSFLKKDEQENLFATMESEEATPSLSQAQRMKQLSQSGRLDMDTIFAIMTEEKGNQKETLKINTSKLKKYFPKNTTPKQMEETIIKLLERELQRKRNRDSR